MPETLTPEDAAARLCELSADARSAVLLDAAGAPAGSSEADPERARELGELARELFETVDRATRDWDFDPPEQVEAQVPGGAVFASRTPRWTLVVVARRAALASLMLWDLRAVLGELEGGAPIRRSMGASEEHRASEEGGSEEDAASGLPLPELGRSGPEYGPDGATG